MHKITCSECGKEAEVPFKPSGDRPVYCKDCFSKKRGSFR
ncbi:MAG: CxxC-x17-CxxC domain-containing protein [Nitrosopumilus sp.]